MKKFLLEDRPCKRIYDTRVFFFVKINNLQHVLNRVRRVSSVKYSISIFVAFVCS